MLTREVNGIAQQGCDNAKVINLLNLGNINSELENAIVLLDDGVGEETIEEVALLLEDYTNRPGFDEVLIANASTSLLRFYSYIRNVKRSIKEAYKCLNGKECEL